jgi:hypothetical protein
LAIDVSLYFALEFRETEARLIDRGFLGFARECCVVGVDQIHHIEEDLLKAAQGKVHWDQITAPDSLSESCFFAVRRHRMGLKKGAQRWLAKKIARSVMGGKWWKWFEEWWRGRLCMEGKWAIRDCLGCMGRSEAV